MSASVNHNKHTKYGSQESRVPRWLSSMGSFKGYITIRKYFWICDGNKDLDVTYSNVKIFLLQTCDQNIANIVLWFPLSLVVSFIFCFCLFCLWTQEYFIVTASAVKCHHQQAEDLLPCTSGEFGEPFVLKSNLEIFIWSVSLILFYSSSIFKIFLELLLWVWNFSWHLCVEKWKAARCVHETCR